MKHFRYPCPCGGKVKWKKDKVTIDGVDCGIFQIFKKSEKIRMKIFQ